ncbi:iron(II)-dependent oxidoreductase EgtB [Mycobacterium tuberculosis variant bovis BCG]|nr:iron(II)-dependent oxidoreductase EgtB [Mycobacterium tuberculosis variant bovis BCG]AMC92190.1 iron(II)-dependent oxidoreductase EgtB [Mycobacterium tuberculosis]
MGSGDWFPPPLPVGNRGAHRHLCQPGRSNAAPRAGGCLPGRGIGVRAEQMLGDVWEWTTSPLRPWPGFVPMVYERYSQPFFGGDYRVLRGGSWAVEPAILRPSFRNWDHPYRRQIFAGVRLAWDI